MITHEEYKTAQEYAQANLDQVKQIKANIIRRPKPIYSESGKVIGHRLVRVATKVAKPIEAPEINSNNDTNMKTCTKCSKKKPVDNFNKMTKAKDGLQSWCKQCKNTGTIEKQPRPTVNRPKVVIVDDIAFKSCKHDEGKLRYDLCPPHWSEAIAEVMTSGLVKYQPNGWRSGEACSFEAALMRHFIAWRKGEVNDSESKLNHLKHVATNALILLSLTTQTPR